MEERFVRKVEIQKFLSDLIKITTNICSDWDQYSEETVIFDFSGDPYKSSDIIDSITASSNKENTIVSIIMTIFSCIETGPTCKSEMTDMITSIKKATNINIITIVDEMCVSISQDKCEKYGISMSTFEKRILIAKEILSSM